MSKKQFYLPKFVKPNLYSLSIIPNMKKFTYEGKVEIDLNVEKSVETIVLHSKELEINKVSVNQKSEDKQVEIKSLSFDKENETLKIPINLSTGKALLKILFSGTINDKMIGFYRTKVIDPSGKVTYAACTQFEPIDARMAFPCWDEPDFKASFKVKITAEKIYTVLSNSPVEKKENQNDKIIHHFEKSPLMSTYLLAFFIGEFEKKSIKSSNNVNLNIYSPPHLIEKTNWALKVAKESLDFFENYFGIKYPLPKYDSIAIPDFVNGAMENWGLVTYRDSAVLSDEKSSVSSKQRVAHVVAHETAHQWFGNLVTMKWWSQLWLNEGFATFMQTVANHDLNPKWNVWIDFLEEKIESALILDSLVNSRPIETSSNEHKMEINEMFDIISYQKGASLLRMLSEYIGQKNFKKGICNYLKKYKYSNADSIALWDSLSEASNKDISSLMLCYTRKQGYPIIEVKCDRKEGNKHCFNLKQSRFLSNGENIDNDNTIWKVPLKVDIGGNKKWILFDEKEMDFEFEVPNEEYIRFNSGGSSFVRVMHSKDILKTQKKALSEKRLGPEDRFVILSDLKAFLTAGKVKSADVLDILSEYRSETDETVWNAVFGVIKKFKGIVEDTEMELKFCKFAINLLTPLAQNLGYQFKKGEPDRTEKLRGTLIAMLAGLNHKETLDFLKVSFDKFVSSDLINGQKYEINSNIFHPMLYNAVKHGGKNEFKTALKLSQTLQDAQKKNQALSSIAASKKPEIIDEALNLILTDKIRNQDTIFVFVSAYRNRFGKDLSLEFLKKNYNVLRSTYKHDSLFSSFISVVSTIKDLKVLKETEQFFNDKNTKGYEKRLFQSIEYAKLNINLKEKEFENIKNWINGHCV